MNEPKFSIGQSVYVMPTVNRTVQVVDRYWEEDLKPEPSYQYKISGSPAWFPESQLKTYEEMEEFLETEYDVESEDNWLYEPLEYDGDTGRAFINGKWIVLDSRRWGRFLLS